WDVENTAMLPPTGYEPWGLRITHRSKRDPDVPWWRYARDSDTTDIRGDQAVQAAAHILPYLNSRGASARVVQQAVALASRGDDPIGSFSDAAHIAARQPKRWSKSGKSALLAKIPAEMRLALEMVSHE